MTVRKALEKDIPRILELLVQVDMVHHNGRPDIFKGPATKYDADELKDILKDPKTPVFVCVDDNDIPQGHAFCVHKQIKNDAITRQEDDFAQWYTDVCKKAELMDYSSVKGFIIYRPYGYAIWEQIQKYLDARGRHIGKALYDHVIEYARREGFYNVTLNVWSLNPSAMKFYEAMGLKPQKVGMELIL